jgi:hypothetical protein
MDMDGAPRRGKNARICIFSPNGGIWRGPQYRQGEIERVDVNGPAHRAGVKVNKGIVAVNGHWALDADDVEIMKYVWPMNFGFRISFQPTPFNIGTVEAT